MHADKATYVKMFLETVLYILFQATFTIIFTAAKQAFETRNAEKLSHAYLPVDYADIVIW